MPCEAYTHCPSVHTTMRCVVAPVGAPACTKACSTYAANGHCSATPARPRVVVRHSPSGGGMLLSTYPRIRS
eukprot:2601113-Rhodomonas_salina.2